MPQLIRSPAPCRGRWGESHVRFPELGSQVTAVPGGETLIAALSLRGLVRCPGRSHALLLPHVHKRQPGAKCNYIKNRMCWVGRQAQLVNLLPGANADTRWIGLGTLLGQIAASFFGAFELFVCEPLGGCLDEVHRMRRHGRRSTSVGRASLLRAVPGTCKRLGPR